MEVVMNARKVSVAEGKRSFTQLLKEAERTQPAILVFRREQSAKAILLPTNMSVWRGSKPTSRPYGSPSS
jgi:hypothetical protein